MTTKSKWFWGGRVGGFSFGILNFQKISLKAATGRFESDSIDNSVDDFLMKRDKRIRHMLIKCSLHAQCLLITSLLEFIPWAHEVLHLALIKIE